MSHDVQAEAALMQERAGRTLTKSNRYSKISYLIALCIIVASSYVAIYLFRHNEQNNISQTHSYVNIIYTLSAINSDLPPNPPETYINVTDKFRANDESGSFSDLVNAFAALDHRTYVVFDESKFNIDTTYTISIRPPNMYRIPIENNKYRLTWGLVVRVIYLGRDRYKTIDARIVEMRI